MDSESKLDIQHEKRKRKKKYGTQQQLTASYLSSVLKGRAQVAVDLGSRVLKWFA